MERTSIILSVCFLMTLSSCTNQIEPTDENKIFHAAPNMSGFGGQFFSLYKGNVYQFCDGDFMDPGCYNGKFDMNGDTLILNGLKLNSMVESNRFLICRYLEQDSTFWIAKAAGSYSRWKDIQEADLKYSNAGDIYELDENNQPRMDKTYYYVIRQDEIENTDNQTNNSTPSPN